MNKDLDTIYSRLFLEKGVPCHISVLISGTEHIGSSWCALSLAHAFTLQKKKVLLVDGNGNFSNICSYMLLSNPLYLEDYVSGKKTLNQLICAYKNKDFNILTANSGNNYLETLPQGRIHIFADDLRIIAKNYDHTFIDIGANLTEKNLCLCQIADDITILCSEQSSDLVKTLDLFQFLNKNPVRANYNLIINRVNSIEDGYKIYKEFCKAIEKSGLNKPNLLGMIRFDTRIRDTVKNKELLLARYPASEAAIDVCNIAEKLNLENEYA